MALSTNWFPPTILAHRLKDQQPLAPPKNGTSVFERNLEEAFATRRENNSYYSFVQTAWQDSGAVDFSSTDTLSLGSSGLLRAEFLKELAGYPNFMPGPGGSRLSDGNYTYLDQVEREIADFHGAETGIIVGSGFEANIAIFMAVPRPGDVIVYDELVHISTHEGMKQSLATKREGFRHNDVQHFRETLRSILASQPLIKRGKRSVIIAVESVYSMDGDVCPLEELLQITKELFPDGNVAFVVDEAHSTGLIGPRGAGLVCELKLEKEIAMVVHTYGKALASAGAVILGNMSIRTALANFSRSVIYSTSPAFPTVASIRAGYNLLRDGRSQEPQDRVQHLVRYFMQTLTSHPSWEKAHTTGLLTVPLSSDWEQRAFLAAVVPIRTREQYHFWFYFHVICSGFSILPVGFPTVARGKSRLRVTFHAKNTEAEAKKLVDAIFEWVQELTDIEEGRGPKGRLPRTARQVYAWMKAEGLSGFGLV